MSNILKKVCSAQKQYCAEHADSMESGNVEERNRHYRSLKMQAAGAWLFAVPLLLLSIFRDHVTYGNEIQMLLAIPVLLFLGVSLYTDAWKQFRMGRITMDMLIAFSMFVAFLFSLFNTFFPDYWYEVGLQPHVYYEVAVLTVAVGLTGKVFRFLPDELHDGDRMAGIIFPALTGIAIFVFVIWILFGGMEAVPHALYSVISIFIVACPCALGLVTPVALMRGIGKAARMHILIKDSLALERLSKADIVVFDKTGTLTCDKIVLEKYINADGSDDHSRRILRHAFLNSYFQTGLKNLMDKAILAHVREENLEHLTEGYTKIDEIPFDFSRRRMSVVIEDQQGKRQIITKGAVEEMLNICSHAEFNGQVYELTDKLRSKAKRISDDMNRNGMRVLAIAQKSFISKARDFAVLLVTWRFLIPPSPLLPRLSANCANMVSRLRYFPVIMM